MGGTFAMLAAQDASNGTWDHSSRALLSLARLHLWVAPSEVPFDGWHLLRLLRSG